MEYELGEFLGLYRAAQRRFSFIQGPIQSDDFGVCTRHPCFRRCDTSRFPEVISKPLLKKRMQVVR